MTIDPTVFRTEVLLSLQRALWDMVTPALRAVAVRPVPPLIEARFIYEAMDEEAPMIVAEVEACVSADFMPPVDVCFTASAIPLGSPLELDRGEEWVFRRREVEPD